MKLPSSIATVCTVLSVSASVYAADTGSPFYGDPPDCWDPCDCRGNYTGGRCHSCGGGYVDDGMPVAREKIVSQTDQAVGPTPRAAPQPHKAVKPPPEQ